MPAAQGGEGGGDLVIVGWGPSSFSASSAMTTTPDAPGRHPVILKCGSDKRSCT